MKNILFLADSWGYSKGGINSFNIELCKSVAELLPSNINISCLTPFATASDISDAKEINVRLLSLHNDPKIDSFQKSDMFKAYDLFKDEVTWIIGHDVVTGNEAIELKNMFCKKNNWNSKVGIIHHMDYESYSVFKEISKRTNTFYEKINTQRQTLNKADILFALGPYLKDSASDIFGSEVSMLIPGLYDTILYKKKSNKFKIITFGRLGIKNDVIKQTSLVVKAFGRAVFKDKRLKESILTIIGISDGNKQLKELLKLGEDYASRRLTINGIPYVQDRVSLQDILSQHTICIMPSFREGFGLVGWEAISSNVPIIISDVSGLYKFLSKFGGAVEGCINKIDITATDEDIENLSNLIIEIYNNVDKAKNNAISLKKFLVKCGYIWQKTANDFLIALGIHPNPLKRYNVPFKYLSSFTEKDNEIFYGRNKEIKEFITILNNNNQYLLLFGKSGVGKTSFINAGIIPKLDKKLFRTKTIRVRSVDDTLNEIIDFMKEVEKTKTTKIIIIDQFEEIFIHYNDFDRKRLFKYILNNNQQRSIKYIFSFREDFLAELHDIEKTLPNIFDNRYRLKNLSLTEALDAIKNPFKSYNRIIEEELVQAIINDLKTSEDSSIFPPQLQIICYTLYIRFCGQSKVVKYKDYERIGYFTGILSEYVDSALEIFNFQDKNIAKEILKKMVSSKDTKIPLKYSDIVLSFKNEFPELKKNRIDEIITSLISSRLIIKYEYSVELAYELTHEYLIQKIKEWISIEAYKLKEIEESIKQEEMYWKTHKKPMEFYKFEHINRYKGNIILDNLKKALLLRTSLEYNYDVEYWLKENFSNPYIIDFLYDNYTNIDSTYVKCRIIPTLLLFDISIEQKHFLFNEILKIGDRTILINYKNWTTHFNNYNIKVEVEIRRNLESYTLKRMVFVEEGDYYRGIQKGEIETLILSGIPRLFLDDIGHLEKKYVGAFLIDKYLVTNNDFKQFSQKHTYKVGQEYYPATSISFDSAIEYAKFVDKIIPNDVIWEKAARGNDCRSFPWGNDWDSSFCNTRLSGISGTTPVNKYENGISPYGCYDMAGNVWEWTNTWKEITKTIVVKGGSWVQMKILPWCWYKFNYENEGQQNVGFRCARIVENDIENSEKVYSSGGVIIEKTNESEELKVLLCGNSKSTEWRLPKGMLNKGEKVRDCAIREVLEETGYQTIIKKFVGFINWSYIYNGKVWDETVFFYLMQIKDYEVFPHDKEFDIVKWFPIQEAIELITYENEKEIILQGIEIYKK